VRRRRDDLWIATTALFAAMCALPLAQTSWHGSEVASTLAVAAVAMLAGQRWAIAVLVLCELLLVPTAWPRAFLPDADLAVRLAAFGSLVAIVPGVLAIRRAAAALVVVTGWRRTKRTCRHFSIALVAIGLLAASAPLLF
jgi:hypothetical protein